MKTSLANIRIQRNFSLLSLLLVLALPLAACGPKAGISETRMMHAPARTPDCALEFVQVDMTSMGFNSAWDLLGYITFLDTKNQDPMAAQNRKLARPRACGMGGTAIAVAMNSTNTDRMGQQGSGLIYMVLRPKSQVTAQPTAF
tara:strand:- start:39540 stop:39971 length:432 start_codon:yes stop_codon:yes gene_type:complete